MNKLIFGGLLGILASISIPANAQKPGNYVRKPMPAPNFFVPQKALPQPEKLPPFYMPEPAAAPRVVTPDIPAETATFEQEEVITDEETSPVEEFNPNLDVSLPQPEEAVKPENTEPKYKQEYDAYVKDLEAIAETGEAPANPELKKDLEKMNSEERLKVDEDGRITDIFQQSQLINPMAYGKELPEQEEEVMSPETAAYFGGTNPFYDGDVVTYEEEKPEEEAQEEPEVVEEEPVAEPEQPEPQPEAYVPAEPKRTRSSGGRGRSSSGSRGNSSGSFNLGPNMIR